MLTESPAYVQIALAIFISLLSGVAGVFIQKFLSRAKPNIRINAIGFKGETISLNEELIRESSDIPWVESIKKFIEFDDLLEYEKKLSEKVEILKLAQDSCKEWLKINKDSNKEIFNKNQLMLTPIFEHSEIPSFLIGELNRRIFFQLPINIETINTHEDIFQATRLEKPSNPLEKEKNGWLLHLGHKGINFIEKSGFSDKSKAELNLVVHSLAKGVSRNIIFLHQHFLNEVSQHIINLESLVKKIRVEITKSALLSIDVNVENTGDTPVVIRPYFLTVVKYGNSRIKLTCESRINEETLTKKTFQQTPIKSSKTNKNHFLNRKQLSKYIFLPGKSVKSFEALAHKPFGENGEKITEYYRLGGITILLKARTLSGKIIPSPKTEFTHTLNNEQIKEIEEY